MRTKRELNISQRNGCSRVGENPVLCYRLTSMCGGIFELEFEQNMSLYFQNTTLVEDVAWAHLWLFGK